VVEILIHTPCRAPASHGAHQNTVRQGPEGIPSFSTNWIRWLEYVLLLALVEGTRHEVDRSVDGGQWFLVLLQYVTAECDLFPEEDE
jgi:hypothetical protein